MLRANLLSSSNVPSPDQVACKAVALVLHFLLLVAFFQMLALGVEIAVTVTYVFSATRSKLCYLILLAWGMSPCVCVYSVCLHLYLLICMQTYDSFSVFVSLCLFHALIRLFLCF